MSVLGTKWLLLNAILLFNVVIQENSAQYIPPAASVEPLYPKGLRMSIPDEDGISLVAYHVKFNDDFYSLEAGTIAIDIIKKRNGRWTYEDRSTRLKRGDKIYYWLHVVYEGLGYNLLNQEYEVKEFYNYDGTPVDGGTADNITCSTPSQTKIFEGSSINQQTKGKTICAGQTIFEENFDFLNTNLWTNLERFSGIPNYEFVVYMKNSDNVEVKDGILHIKPTFTNDKFGPNFVTNGNLTLTSCTGVANTDDCKRNAFAAYILPPVISGRLNTKSSFAFQHGRIQIRAKLPRGDWLYPLLTLENINESTPNSPLHSDIIVAHSNGNPFLKTRRGDDISGHILIAGAHATTINQHSPRDNRLMLPKKTSTKLWSDDYHVYDLEWKSDRITLKVDEEQYGDQEVPPSLFNNPAYINIGLAVGGHLIFPDGCVSSEYAKPWRDVESKALLNFYSAANKWQATWRNSDTGLHIDYIKILAV
ncbi:beta-1,3-glucan-binding protein 1 [Bombus impatiens]|uniref:Beta-1,3-glucan-binding protein 1 n=1 Tax=Bombus impatiens TaxID=132113 RepID=A0A6P3UVU3_BOMIM|nr:beta-1,3-glucan-binding protein 1 [Bombus impatiens]